MSKRVLIGSFLGIFTLIFFAFIGFIAKYHTADTMLIPIEEVATTHYPEDPSNHSAHYDRYGNRTLKLLKRDANHFDFIFQSDDPEVATVVFKNIDLTLFVPIAPTWVRDEPSLEKITLIEREWNRQQVNFAKKFFSS